MTTLRDAQIDAVKSWMRSHVIPQRKYWICSNYQLAISLLDVLEEADIKVREEEIIASAETHVGESYAHN